MRWATAILAVLTAGTQLALFLVAERQLQALGMPGASERLWLRVLWGLLWATPWVLGALLLVSRRAQLATVVLIATAALLLGGSLASIAPAVTWPPFGQVADLSAAMVRFGGLVVWVLAAATALCAWVRRPRGPGLWRTRAPYAQGGYVTLAILAWLPAVFTTTAHAPPGAPRHFVETELGACNGLAAVSSYLMPLVIAGILWTAPRLRRDLAGAVLLTVMVPTLVSGIGALYRVSTETHYIFTPSGFLGLVGAIGVVIVGLLWLIRGDVSDAATDPGRHHPEAPTPRIAPDHG